MESNQDPDEGYFSNENIPLKKTPHSPRTARPRASSLTSSHPAMLRRKQQSTENLPPMKIGSVESEPDLWKAAQIASGFFLNIRKGIQRSKSEDLLPSWDQPDFEELKAKFDGMP